MWLLGAVMVVSALVRIDAFEGTNERLPINGSMIREGTAISLYKGYGYKIYPIPNYRSKGRLIDPKEYLKGQEEYSPENLEYYYLPPGPPTLMAITYRLFGLEYKYYQIVQLFLTWIQILLIYYIGRTVFSSPLVGVIASFLYGISPFEINYSFYLAREVYVPSAFIVSIAAAVYIVTHCERSIFSGKNIIIAGLTGLWVGICALFKSPSLFFLFLLAVAVLPRFGLKKTAVLCCAAVISCCVVLAPWVTRNKLVAGKWGLSASSGGISSWAGIGANANPLGQSLTDSVALNSARLYFRLSGIRDVKNFYKGGAESYSKISVEKATQYIRTNPHSYYKALLQNIKKNLLQFTEWPYYDFYYAAIPELKLTKKVLGNKAYNRFRSLIKAALIIIPILSSLAIIAAFIQMKNGYLLVVFLAGAVLSLSLLLSGHCKYAYHILTIHYLIVAYLMHYLVLFVRQSLSREI